MRVVSISMPKWRQKGGGVYAPVAGVLDHGKRVGQARAGGLDGDDVAVAAKVQINGGRFAQ